MVLLVIETPPTVALPPGKAKICFHVNDRVKDDGIDELKQNAARFDDVLACTTKSCDRKTSVYCGTDKKMGITGCVLLTTVVVV